MKKAINQLFIIAMCIFSLTQKSEAQVEEKPIQITKNLYAITSLGGGNIAFLVTTEGVLVIDSGTSPSSGDQIVAIIKKVTDQPVKYLVYTHSHGDHVGGAMCFPESVKVVAHQNLIHNLKTFTEVSVKNNIEKAYPEYLESLKKQIEGQSLDSSALVKLRAEYNNSIAFFEQYKKIRIRYPDITFSDSLEIPLGGDKVILKYLGNAHTNDNIVVVFPSQKVIHAGDLIFNNKRVPWVIAAQGASTLQWVRILEKLYSEKYSVVIPGHGDISDSSILLAQAEYFKNLQSIVAKYKKDGVSLDEIKKLISERDEYKILGNQGQLPANIEVVYSEIQ